MLTILYKISSILHFEAALLINIPLRHFQMLEATLE